jgi:hypothetical protein
MIRIQDFPRLMVSIALQMAKERPICLAEN